MGTSLFGAVRSVKLTPRTLFMSLLPKSHDPLSLRRYDGFELGLDVSRCTPEATHVMGC